MHNMKVIGFFLFLIFLVAKSKAKYVEGHIKTLEVEKFSIGDMKKIYNRLYSRISLGLGLCVKILFSIRERSL